MNSDQNYNPIFTFLCADLYHLHHIAKDYLHSAKKLWDIKDKGNGDHLQSCCLLISTAFELLLKTYIAIDECIKQQSIIHTEESINSAVLERQKKCRHDISRCMQEAQLEKELLIKRTERFSNDFVYDYRIYFQDGKTLFFKDSEAVRFGALASNKDVTISPIYLMKENFEFLDKVDLLIQQKRLEAINLFNL